MRDVWDFFAAAERETCGFDKHTLRGDVRGKDKKFKVLEDARGACA